MLNFIVSTYLLALEVREISFWICPWGLGEVFKITELLMWIPPLFPGGLGFGVTMECRTSRNTGTQNTGTSRNIPEQSKKTRTPQENPEHPKKTRNTPNKTRNTPEKARNTPRKPGTPRKKKTEISKSRWRQYITACVSFSKLPPLIAHKIIWFDLHNLENIYKRHTGTILFLPASGIVMCP